MIKVSVILPVYGVAEFIEDCTRSLLSQTLDEMEFLFVDDHGPDNSIELAQKVIENSPRKEQFHFLRPDKNLGAGMARNYAIPFAQGEYIAFVDSDDTIDAHMFEELYAEAKRLDSDLCCCQMQKYFMDGTKGDIMQNPHVEPGELTHEKRSFILTHYVSLFASFLFRRSMVVENDIHFPEDRAADDSFFVSSAWMVARSVAYVDKPFYHYLIRPGSVCTTKDSNKYQKRVNVFNKLLQYSKDHNVYEQYKDELDFMYIKKGYLSSVINYVTNSLQPLPSTITSIRKQCLEQVPDYRDCRYFKGAIKMLDTLVKCCPKCAIPVLRWYAKKKNIIS